MDVTFVRNRNCGGLRQVVRSGAAVLGLLLVFSCSSVPGATYSTHAFYGQSFQGQRIVDSYFAHLTESGKTIGYLSLPGQNQLTSIYSPETGHTLLGVSNPFFYITYKFYQINNAGNVIWNGYDENFNPVPTFYVNGSITYPNLGAGQFSFQDLNDNNDILGIVARGTYGEPGFEVVPFVYSNGVVTDLPKLGNLDLYPIGINNNGLTSFRSIEVLVDTPEEFVAQFTGMQIHKIGTSNYTRLSDPEKLGDELFYYDPVFTADGGIYCKVEDVLLDPNDPYNYTLVSKRIVFYNEDGSIKSVTSLPLDYYSFYANNANDMVALNSDRQISHWDGIQWTQLHSSNFPRSAKFVSIDGYNSQGTIIGLVEDLPGLPEYLMVAFYATPVPEPSSVMVLGGLMVLVGVRVRTSRHRRQ
ncbi:MAG: hypothetical protein ACKOBW_12140 [Planctomycetota bacterium]